MFTRINDAPGFYGPNNSILVRVIDTKDIEAEEVKAMDEIANARSASSGTSTGGKRKLPDFITDGSVKQDEDDEDDEEDKPAEITIDDLKAIKSSLENKLEAMDPSNWEANPRYDFYDHTPPSSQASSFHYSQESVAEVAELEKLVPFLMDTVAHDDLIDQAKKMFQVTPEMAKFNRHRHNDDLFSDLYAHLGKEPLILLNLVNLSLKALTEEVAVPDELPRKKQKRVSFGPASFVDPPPSD